MIIMDDAPAPAGERGATRRLSVGFLGTGIMGAHMARRIAQTGHKATAFGVAQACDAAAAARGADAVICMLSSGPVWPDPNSCVTSRHLRRSEHRSRPNCS